MCVFRVGPERDVGTVGGGWERLGSFGEFFGRCVCDCLMLPAYQGGVLFGDFCWVVRDEANVLPFCTLVDFAGQFGAFAVWWFW